MCISSVVGSLDSPADWWDFGGFEFIQNDAGVELSPFLRPLNIESDFILLLDDLKKKGFKTNDGDKMAAAAVGTIKKYINKKQVNNRQLSR